MPVAPYYSHKAVEKKPQNSHVINYLLAVCP